MSTVTRNAAALDSYLVAVSADQPGAASAEFRIGLRSMPGLADHSFQDMVVLPGSYYIEMARCVERQLSQPSPRLFERVTFHRPIILSDEDAVIKVDLRDDGDGRVDYMFYESEIEGSPTSAPSRQHAATLTVDRNGTTSSAPPEQTLSIEELQARSDTHLDSAQFYRRLRQNGNQYGPGFQRVRAVWLAGDQALGRIVGSSLREREEVPGQGARILDSVTQVLASPVIDRGKTFVLQSIRQLVVTDGATPEILWAQATLDEAPSEDSASLAGHVQVFDQDGAPHLLLAGVTFALLDNAEVASAVPADRLVVAANFTAEPVEDVLHYWADHFDHRVDLEFAPYNQVFQQLLDTSSAFHGTRDGFNIILLAMEEWVTTGQLPTKQLGVERAKECFGDRKRRVLPNGLEIVHLNDYETDYLYKEIFEDQTYLRHGIHLPDGATVVDVGANVGLFSLFVSTQCDNPTIYAFEPAPVVYDLLKANADAYGTNIKALDLGVSDRPKTAQFTFYDQSSVFSGFHADEREDREAVEAVVRNTLASYTSADKDTREGLVAELTADRLRGTVVERELTSVSALIREHQIDRIDLLKIDAERSELEILRGVEEGDWPKIVQIVIEIHDRTQATVNEVKSQLTARGYRCVVEEEDLLKRSGLFILYATKEPATGDSVDRASLPAGGDLLATVQDFCSALDGFVRRAMAPVIVCLCPRTPKALADPALSAALDNAERVLLSHTGTLPNTHTIGSSELVQRYPVIDSYDPQGHRLGHMPYTDAGYVAIGTSVYRRIFGLKTRPAKVIVLDCDNTLWRGVCGEDGPLGVEVTGSHRRLQQFMVEQMSAGTLLCLCSKNNEDDVVAVFEQCPDMVLKLDHIVSRRINWNRKSDNVRSLAEELDLGLDSFIFLDDSPVECADVRTGCPGVLTLQLPGAGSSFSRFLHHVWAFDHATVTEEDRGRTRMYRENADRQVFRKAASSLGEFINGLRLQVDIAEATEDDVARVSQLTYRTNQFNFTTRRRSEPEIREFLREGDAKCLVVRVSDRFGDYGLVGVVLYVTQTDRFMIDTFLLSCRVLGRGVEHSILSQLGRKAVEEGKRYVELSYEPSKKNAPVREFLKSIGAEIPTAGSATLPLPANHVAQLEYNPAQATEAGGEPRSAPAVGPSAAPVSPEPGAKDSSDALQLIAENLHDVERIARVVDDHRYSGATQSRETDVTADGEFEDVLLRMWRNVLRNPELGVNDNFFDVGGTSLRAVQLIAMIMKEMKQKLSIVSLFESPTVALLANRMHADADGAGEVAAHRGAALRGQQRRSVRRRKGPRNEA